MGRSNSHQRNKVAEAKRVVGEALGDAARPSQPPGVKYTPEPARDRPEPRPSESLLMLTLTDVAARLGISRNEVERMVAAGRLTGLKAGWMTVVPSAEVSALLLTR